LLQKNRHKKPTTQQNTSTKWNDKLILESHLCNTFQYEEVCGFSPSYLSISGLLELMCHHRFLILYRTSQMLLLKALKATSKVSWVRSGCQTCKSSCFQAVLTKHHKYSSNTSRILWSRFKEKKNQTKQNSKTTHSI